MIFAVLRARGGRLKSVSLAVILVAFLFVAGFIRPVRIAGDHGSGTLWLWAWQKGRIEFINSVTGRPVVIRFKMPWRFSNFSVRTDPGTEEYYTAGKYSWNEQLSKEQTRMIIYCSEVGITLTLGKTVFHEQGGCISASLLWPREVYPQRKVGQPGIGADKPVGPGPTSTPA